MVELLLGKGADANAENVDGQTPLSSAAQKHYQAVLQVLLTAHANPNAGRVNLPLATAAYQGDMPALKLLLANGADPNTNSQVTWGVNTRSGNYGQGGKFTPLFLSVSRRHADVAEELLRCKANPSVTAEDGNPLLYEALPDAPTLKVLLEGGADPNVRASGSTPLLLQAVMEKNQSAVDLLLAHKANVHAEGPIVANNAQSAVWTPLHAAASYGLKAIAELLLKAGADVKARNNDGNTPLHCAVMSGQRELAELLLASKADPNERNNAGQTPLDVAKSQAQSAQGQRPGAPGYPGIRVPAPMGRPGGYPGQLPGTPATAQAQEPKPETMADLLRRHGAADDLPRLDCVELRRPSANYSSTVFTKGTNDWNQFTLLELIAVQYRFLAGSPWGEALPVGQ
jgi:ankyrin repeat protein